RIAIFASGGGSNALQLLNHFQESTTGEVVLLVTHNLHSGVFDFGPKFEVPVGLISKKQSRDGAYLQQLLEDHSIDLIVLAGYLKLIPESIVRKFDQRIINIHPALLPAYGGKGMYGMKVHEAVIEAQELHSGLTIHYVNEVYDQGEILFQKRVKIEDGWTAKQLQVAILKEEHKNFSKIVEKVCADLLKGT
ncbi:UNVERIFIED_CONTAM: hypothetical protein GTU68_048838, partial [Idotea baltica]|nr:hypothetical protein [Idotea baltica]